MKASFLAILALFLSVSLAYADQGAAPPCLDNQGRPLAINNAQVINWEQSTPNEFKARAHVSGTLTQVFPDHSGHHHFAIQIGGQSGAKLEIIYNAHFGAMPPLRTGMTVEACGDYITATAQSGPYPPSPDGAILHWVHEATHGRHPSGFVMLDGVVYGYKPGGGGYYSARFPRLSQTTDQFFENSTGSPILSLLSQARHSIDIETYSMNDPQMDQEIRDAVNRGVKVQVVEESSPVGAACHPFGGSSSASSQTPSCLRQQKLVNFVNDNGGRFVPFAKDLCGRPGSRCFQHGKIAIIDGSQALLSTGNFDSTSLCDLSQSPRNCDRDYTIVTQDTSVVRSLRTIFENDLVDKSSDLGNIGSSRLTVSPDSMKPIVDFINSAKKSLQIETQYLNDPTMNQAVIDAANRGVNVSVMVSSACSFGRPRPYTIRKWQATYSAFDSAGIQTRIFDGAMKVGGIRGYLHAKAIIVDGNRAWTGSANGSTTSLTNNREYGLFLDDATTISKLDRSVTADFQNPKAESWQDSLACRHEY